MLKWYYNFTLIFIRFLFCHTVITINIIYWEHFSRATGLGFRSNDRTVNCWASVFCSGLWTSQVLCILQRDFPPKQWRPPWWAILPHLCRALSTTLSVGWQSTWTMSSIAWMQTFIFWDISAFNNKLLYLMKIGTINLILCSWSFNKCFVNIFTFYNWNYMVSWYSLADTGFV